MAVMEIHLVFLMSKEKSFNKLKRNVKEKNQTYLPKQKQPSK